MICCIVEHRKKSKHELNNKAMVYELHTPSNLIENLIQSTIYSCNNNATNAYMNHYLHMSFKWAAHSIHIEPWMMLLQLRVESIGITIQTFKSSLTQKSSHTITRYNNNNHRYKNKIPHIFSCKQIRHFHWTCFII